MGAGSGACAACLQQQQHTHSRNSSNTSGDMSSKVRPRRIAASSYRRPVACSE